MNMEAMHSISFIGMAGCGKSTLGKAVSEKLNLNFIDTDILIENDFNCSLEDIKKKHTTEVIFSNVSVNESIKETLFHERNLRKIPKI